MTLEKFEPAIPANEWPQTHTGDCAATGIGPILLYGVSFLLDRQEPAQRSARRSASVASYVASRWGSTVDDWS